MSFLRGGNLKLQNKISLGQTSNPVCEWKGIITRGSREEKSCWFWLSERMQQRTSQSNVTSFYSVFDKAHGKGGALNRFRKSRKKVKIISPPAHNSKITDHFQPNLASKRSNEPGSNLVRKPGEKLYSCYPIVTPYKFGNISEPLFQIFWKCDITPKIGQKCLHYVPAG